MGQVGHGSAVGRAAFLEVGRRNEQGGDDAGGHEEDAHDHRRGLEQAPGIADAGLEVFTIDQRHDGDAGLEAREAEGQPGKKQHRDADDGEQASVLSEDGAFPVEHQVGVQEDVNESREGDDQVEGEIDTHKNHGNIDRFLKALEENGAQDGEQEESNVHLVLQGMRSVGIVDKVGRCIGGREGHGDDEVGGGETQKDEHEDFAGPPREQLFQHGNAALAVGAGGSDAIVNRQRGEESHQDEDKGCDRREETGGEECDTGLVAEGGEVVDPSETHDAPPGVFARDVGGVSTLGTFKIGKKPVG